MIIRNIRPEDNAAMAKIIRSCLLEFGVANPGTVYFDESTDRLSEVYTEKKSAYFIMKDDKEIAGGAGIFPTDELPPKTCELVKMYIAKKFRRNGYGQTLLEKCIAEAKKEGYEKMYLESMPELTNAIAMYVKNGFTHISGPLGNSGHNGCHVWMIKNL